MHMHAHMQNAHIYVYMLNMIISIGNGSSIGGIPGDSL